jgi:hypothetical protein
MLKLLVLQSFNDSAFSGGHGACESYYHIFLIEVLTVGLIGGLIEG